MKQIHPGEQHVIIASRIQDGAVGLFYTREPGNWLAAIAAHFQLASVEVRPSSAAPKVIEALRRRFAVAHTPYDTMPWFLVDFRQAVEALNALDVETGEPRRDLEIAARVMVLPQRLRGSVVGYTRRGQVAVKLVGNGAVSNVVIAMRDQVKPILRAKMDAA
jgi:hypothetical protein